MEIFKYYSLNHEVALHLDYDSIINFTDTFKKAMNIWKDNYFWQKKAFQDFGIQGKDFNDTFLSPSERYLQILTEKGQIARGSEFFIGDDHFIRRAIREHREDLVDYMIHQGYTDNLEICLSYAHNQRLDKLVQHSGWIYRRLVNKIVYTGNLEMVQYLMSEVLLRNFSPHDINELMMQACMSKNIKLVEYLLSLFTDRWKELDWNHIRMSTYQSGSIPIFEYILSLLPPDTDLNSTYYVAFASGDPNFVSYILNQYPHIQRNPLMELFYTIHSGNLDLAKHVIQVGNINLQTLDYISFYSNLYISSGSWLVIQYIIRNRPLNPFEYYVLLMRSLRRPFYIEFFKNLVSSTPPTIYNGWSIIQYNHLFEELLNYASYVVNLFLKGLADTQIGPGINWNEILIHMLSGRNKQELDRVFELAGEYLFDWSEILLESESWDNPAMTQYLKKVRTTQRIIG